MIIRILDDDNKHICVYTNGRWFGNLTPNILSAAIEIIVFALKSSQGGAKLFNESIRNWPTVEPEGPQNEFFGPKQPK